jgi:hypothetical protein
MFDPFADERGKTRQYVGTAVEGYFDKGEAYFPKFVVRQSSSIYVSRFFNDPYGLDFSMMKYVHILSKNHYRHRSVLKDLHNVKKKSHNMTFRAAAVTFVAP